MISVGWLGHVWSFNSAGRRHVAPFCRSNMAELFWRVRVPGRYIRLTLFGVVGCRMLILPYIQLYSPNGSKMKWNEIKYNTKVLTNNNWKRWNILYFCQKWRYETALRARGDMIFPEFYFCLLLSQSDLCVRFWFLLRLLECLPKLYVVLQAQQRLQRITNKMTLTA